MSVNLEKPTPIECLEQRIAMTEARQMRPEDLNREDCQRLLEAGFENYVIARLYGFSETDFFSKLKEWGLNKPLKNWDFQSDRRSDRNKSDGPSRLTPADLTREQAARMLLAGVSKPDIRRKYNFPNASALYARLEEWGLHKKGLPLDFESKQKEVRKMAAAVLKEIEQEKQILQTKTELTEEEKLDLFGEQEPSIEAVQKAAEDKDVKDETPENSMTELFSVDLSTWEPVDYTKARYTTAPYLWVSAKGYGVIGNTDLRPSSYVQFRIDPAGCRIAVIPASQGQLLYNEEAKQRRRFSGNHLARRLQAKGIKLPARFHLEWNEAAGAYIGVLVEKIEKLESEAV